MLNFSTYNYQYIEQYIVYSDTHTFVETNFKPTIIYITKTNEAGSSSFTATYITNQKTGELISNNSSINSAFGTPLVFDGRSDLAIESVTENGFYLYPFKNASARGVTKMYVQ